MALHSDASSGPSEVAGAPRLPGLPSPVKGYSKSRSLTCSRPPPPPQRRSLPRRFPRPASQDHAPSSLWPIAGRSLRRFPPLRLPASNPRPPAEEATPSPASARARAAVQLARGSRPKGARRFSGSRPGAVFRRMRASSLRRRANGRQRPRACLRTAIHGFDCCRSREFRGAWVRGSVTLSAGSRNAPPLGPCSPVNPHRPRNCAPPPHFPDRFPGARLW